MEKPFPAERPILEILSRRWSGRAIDPDRPVSRATVLTLIEAARVAPSSFNEQPWRFLVFDGADGEALEQARSCLVEGNAWAKKAPLLLLSVAAERWGKDDSPNRHAQHDVGLASENLALQAIAEGLVVHFMAGFDAERARELFGIPEGFTPMAMIAIGYPGSTADPVPELRERELAPRRPPATYRDRLHRALEPTVRDGGFLTCGRTGASPILNLLFSRLVADS